MTGHYYLVFQYVIKTMILLVHKLSTEAFTTLFDTLYTLFFKRNRNVDNLTFSISRRPSL